MFGHAVASQGTQIRQIRRRLLDVLPTTRRDNVSSMSAGKFGHYVHDNLIGLNKYWVIDDVAASQPLASLSQIQILEICKYARKFK